MHFSKTIGLAFATATIAGSAFAADLPSRRMAPAYVAPAPVFTWTGFYAGLNAGYTWAGSNTVNLSSAPISTFPRIINGFPVRASIAAALATTGSVPAQSSGFIGGGQIGWNYQFSSSFLAGVETDVQGVAAARSSGSLTNAVDALSGAGFPGNNVIAQSTANNRLKWLGTLRGRLGYLPTQSLLLYVTGGLAYGGVSSNVNIFGANAGFNLGLCCANPTFGSQISGPSTRVGYTLGGGGEWMFAQNWSLKVEYLYYDLGSVVGAGFSTPIAGPSGSNIPAGTPIYTIAHNTRTRLNGHIVRAGLNYHFNWGSAPVVAKY